MSSRRLACLSALLLLAIPKAPLRGAEISKFLPEDTQIVLCVNVRQILDSELVKKYALEQMESALKGNSEAQEMVTALALDPVKDVASITFAAPGNVSDNKWMILVRGHFDSAKVHEAAQKFAQSNPDTLTIHKEGELRLYEARPVAPAGRRNGGESSKPSESRKDSQPIFVALLDKENLVASPVKEYVLEAAAKNAGKKPSAVDKNLKEYINQVDGKKSLWLAGVVPEQLKKALSQDKQTKGIVQQLNAVSGGVTLTDGAQAGVRVFLNDAKAARDLRQLLVGVQSLAILAVNGNDQLKDYAPLLTDILSSVKFGNDKSSVSIDVLISAQQIEKGMKK